MKTWTIEVGNKKSIKDVVRDNSIEELVENEIKLGSDLDVVGAYGEHGRKMLNRGIYRETSKRFTQTRDFYEDILKSNGMWDYREKKGSAIWDVPYFIKKHFNEMYERANKSLEECNKYAKEARHEYAQKKLLETDRSFVSRLGKRIGFLIKDMKGGKK